MAICRPAGLSDEDSDTDDDYGYFEKQTRKQHYAQNIENTRQKTETRLQEVLINGDLEGVVKILNEDLKNEVNSKLESGWTPLSHACFHAQEDIVKYLLEQGADPNIPADSVTPIMMACSNNTANETTTHNIVLYLIQKDCLLNIGDKYGVTPLMRAVISGHTSVVELILDQDVNIEMRDHQGWTAIFWAIHHNQPQCLDKLLSKGARCNIVDSSNRTPESIAYSHDYSEIQAVLQRHMKTSDNNETEVENVYQHKDYLEHLTQWQDYYPTLRDETKPKYANEITKLLYGMNCDRLKKIFHENPMDLRKFLLLEEEDMIKLGIDMPFERQRLKQGLRSFHTRTWKINAVAGLQAQRGDFYSIIDCLNILGNHLQQLYILESTLTYVLRDYNGIQNQIKFEPPDSPSLDKLHNTAKKMISNINNVKKEINAMKRIHTKLSKDSVKPVDLITEKTKKEIAMEVFTELVVLGSLGLLAYHAKSLFTNLIKK